ncbi:MAG: hypothetical protein U0640_04115 [Phycisphaerales bacterium]
MGFVAGKRRMGDDLRALGLFGPEMQGFGRLASGMEASADSAKSVILAGIDEAGYGPLLGPLCVGLSVFEVPVETDGAGLPAGGVPNLWEMLSEGVCREAGRGGKPDARGRIAIADSKQLKLSSSVTTTHPLVHLERGVLTMVRAMGRARERQCEGAKEVSEESEFLPRTDSELLTALCASWPAEEWYAVEAKSLPLAHSAGQLAIAAALLERTLEKKGVTPLAMRCRVMGEGEFNQTARGVASESAGEDVVQAVGKAATTGKAVREHMQLVWQRWGQASVSPSGELKGRLGIVCDRQGGRMQYGHFLQTCFPGAAITVVEESELRSRYVVEDAQGAMDGTPRRAGVTFLVEGEQAHLPVAMASMIAKLVRETCMDRFNRVWGARAKARASREIKPTAGYALDAQRWLREMEDLLSDEERGGLIRIV